MILVQLYFITEIIFHTIDVLICLYETPSVTSLEYMFQMMMKMIMKQNMSEHEMIH